MFCIYQGHCDQSCYDYCVAETVEQCIEDEVFDSLQVYEISRYQYCCFMPTKQ